MKNMVYNRQTGIIEEEEIVGKGAMDFFYGTKIGRLLTSLIFKRRFFSKVFAFFPKNKGSVKKIHEFIKQYNINTDEVKDDISSFKSFNDFFIRKLKEDARVISKEQSHLIAPADSKVTMYNISENVIIPVKGINYTLEELTNDKELTEDFSNGICLVFRLAVSDYHRFCYIDKGFQDKIIKINGSLHSVSPVSLATKYKVYQGNYREYCVLHTENFGDVIQIDVGALLVGKIIQNYPTGCSFVRGQEKGYFEFGGSTVILIFKPNTVIIDEDIVSYSKQGIETIIKLGNKIGTKI